MQCVQSNKYLERSRFIIDKACECVCDVGEPKGKRDVERAARRDEKVPALGYLLLILDLCRNHCNAMCCLHILFLHPEMQKQMSGQPMLTRAVTLSSTRLAFFLIRKMLGYSCVG